MFWKLFGSFGTLILTSLGILGAFVSHRTQLELLRNVEHSLTTQAFLLEPTLSPLLDHGIVGEGQKLVEELGKKTAVRITVIRGDGVVLADSNADPHIMENHKDRPEIRELRTRKVASATRLSASVDFRYTYVAIRISDETGDKTDPPRGYIRLAVRVDDLRERIAEMGWIIWGGAFLSALVALLLCVALANHLSVRVEQLSKTANEIAQGDYDRPIDVTGNDQIGSLAHSLHRMRRQLTEHIADSERVRNDLQTMLETLPEAVVALDPDQRILFANPKTYQLFGLKPNGHAGPRPGRPGQNQGISGQKVWEVLRHPGLQEAVARTQKCDSYSTEFEILSPHRVVAYRGTVLNVGNRRGVLMVLHDVSELRRLERMRQDFFANVSHELKTPLAAIKAYTETLLDDDAADLEIRRHFLTRIDEQSNRLHALVVDMLMLARVESKEQAFEIQAVDLGEVLADTMREFAEPAAAKKVSLRLKPAAEPQFVIGDSEGVATIFSNLINNAVKYAREGGWVEISTRMQTDWIDIQVADNGIGIPQEDLGRIFERFYRVDRARSRELGGTGLGLSIVKHLTQTFAGSVWVQSRLNQGSTFTVRLPRATTPDKGTEPVSGPVMKCPSVKGKP